MARHQLHRFPTKHLCTTPKAWRQGKRQQWKLLMNALDTFKYGCAYTPVFPDLYELEKLAIRIQGDLKGEWIAW